MTVVFPYFRPYVKNTLHTHYLIDFSSNLALLLESSPYYKEKKLRLKEVSNLFIIVHLAHGGT